MISALHRKLARDLAHLSGQVVTIALVIACGVASFVYMRGNFASLEAARDAFYTRRRLADVFVSLERAPESVRTDLEAIPGVQRVESRVVEPVTLPLPNRPEPVRGRAISLPGQDPSSLHQLSLVDGRRPEPGHPDEVVLLEAFAAAQGMKPGERIPTILNGRRRDLLVVGLGTTPEWVMAMQPGALSNEPERFAVLWLNREALATAFRMEGAFNDALVALQPDASEAGVIDAVDRALARHGGLGAYGRARQPSNHMVEGELSQLRAMSTFLPSIFLAVAMLLVNVVLSRLVLLQQPEIATLKALGYSDLQVGLHFLELVLVVGTLGAGLGVGGGVWLGSELVQIYGRYFHFPDLHFVFSPSDALVAVAITFAATAAGAFGAVRRVVALPPAEAMRPPAPPRYRRSPFDPLGRLLGPSAQMVIRELERRPLRALLSALAIALATALTVVGGWYYDGIEALIYTQFHEIMREDAAVALLEPRPARAVSELAHLPGVLAAEGLRTVPVRFRAGHRRRDGVVWGYPDGVDMRRLRDKLGRPVPLPPRGLVLTDTLAEILGVRVGDPITLELQEGDRRPRQAVVAGLVDEAFGLQGHMRGEAVAELLEEEPLVNLVLLRTDPREGPRLDERLKAMPGVAEVTRRASTIQKFREQSASMILTAAFILSAFAATITIGVVYNNARVALSMRGRDLASLRVLGLTRGEISAILLGELAVQVLVALPPGLLLGRALVRALASTIDPETYRLPVILTPKSYAFAAAITLLAAVASALLVRRRLDHLDLVAVLKTRE